MRVGTPLPATDFSHAYPILDTIYVVYWFIALIAPSSPVADLIVGIVVF